MPPAELALSADASDSNQPWRAPSPHRGLRDAQVLALCIAAGIGGEALFYRAALGINFVLFMALAASLLALASLSASPTARLVAAALPVIAALPLVLYGSTWARAFGVPAALVALSLVPGLARHGVRLDAFDAIFGRTQRWLGNVVPALARALRAALGLVGGGRLRTALLSLAVGVPSTLVFVVLFSFDPSFANAVGRVTSGSGHVTAFALPATLLTLALVTLTFSANGAALEPSRARPLGPYRGAPAEDSGALDRGREESKALLSPFAWAFALAQVSTVFLLYVALHARELFAGHAHVRHTSGVTYAGQVHAGFASLLVATALSVGLILTGHRLFRARRDRISVGEGRALRAAELLLLALAVPTLASCGQKLMLYVDAYGATYQRLAVGLIVLFIFPLLALTAARSLSPAWPRFFAAVSFTTFSALTLAGFVDADAHIARVNVERALQGKPFDAHYVGRLGSGALVGFRQARPKDGPELARFLDIVGPLLGRWEGVSAGGRGFHRGTTCEAELGSLCQEAKNFQATTEEWGADESPEPNRR